MALAVDNTNRFKKAAIKAVEASGSPRSEDQIKNSDARQNSTAVVFANALENMGWKQRFTKILKDTTKFGEDPSDKIQQFQAVFHSEKNEPSEVLCDLEKQEENLWDVVDQDDEAIEEYASNELMGNLLSNKYFRSGILTAIIVNSLLIAVETDEELERKYKHVFAVLDQCLMTVFVCEILFKWYHGFFMFWKLGWNILDFFIVVALLLGPLKKNLARIGRCQDRHKLVTWLTDCGTDHLTVYSRWMEDQHKHFVRRLIRFGEIKNWDDYDMANIVLLLVIIMLVFSVIGITLFRDTVPQHFGSLSTAMFSLFICLTMDGWIKLNEAFQTGSDSLHVGGTIYLNGFISVGAFIFANLVVAVVVTNLELAMVDVKTEERQAHEHEVLLGKYEKDKDVITPTINTDTVSPFVLLNQKPYQLPEMNDITGRMEELENYFLVLSAFEDNLAQYRKLKSQLIEIFGCICDIHKKARLEGLVKDGEGTQSATETGVDANFNLAGGDIISNLMELEGNRLIDSKRRSLDNLIRGGASALSSTPSHRNVTASTILPFKTLSNQKT